MKPRIIPLLLLILLCSSIALLSCSKNSSAYGGTNNNNNNTTSGSNVNISSSAFGPSSLTVKAGTTVTWTNNDYTTHTVTSNNGSFGSSDMKYGDSFSYTFGSAGTFAYHCIYHSSMTGTIVVTQ